jgi:hypothetical protein
MVLGVAAALALAACSSGDDDNNDSSSKPLSQSEFVEQVDTICADFFSGAGELDTPSFTNDDAPSGLSDDQIAEGEAFFESYLKLEDTQLAKLQKIVPPAAAEKDFTVVVDSWQERRDAAQEAVKAFSDRDDSAYETASSEVTAASFAGAAAAQELGLEKCQGEG